MMKISKKKAYHHGDLRRTLMAVSVDLIDRQGIDALHLRNLATLAGVSSGAPYHHFADRAALLAAIAQEGFEGLEVAMVRARDSVASTGAAHDSSARLQALGCAYVAFAIAHRGHFRVMFRGDSHSQMDPAVSSARERTFQMLCETIVDCQNAGTAPAGDPQPLVLHAWALVHGLATLCVDDSLSKISLPQDHLAPLITQLSCQMFAALAREPAGPAA